MPTCTAPATGRHTLPAAALRCPLHGPQMMKAAGIKAAPPSVVPATRPSPAGPPSGDIDPDADGDTLTGLAMSADTQTRVLVAQHPNTPAGVLSDLALDESVDVRLALLRARMRGSEQLDADSLRILGDDPQPNVRRLVATNANTPPDVIEALGEEGFEYAYTNPNCPPEALARRALDKSEPSGRLEALSNPNCPPEALASAATWPVDGMRETVATNPSTPVETLRTLAASRKASVREAVGKNPNTPPELLTELASDMAVTRRDSSGIQMNSVWMSVAGNPSTPPETLAMLVEREMPSRALQRSTRGEVDYVTAMVRNPNLPGKVLAGVDESVAKAAVWAKQERITALGVDKRNTAAVQALLDQEWWDMTPNSPEVEAALLFHPNP